MNTTLPPYNPKIKENNAYNNIITSEQLPPVLVNSYFDAGNLSADSILQNWVSGILSDFLESEFIRPQWQPVDPPYPAIGVNWCSLGIRQVVADKNTYQRFNEAGQWEVHRHENIDFLTTFYGLQGMELAGVLRDSLTLYENREALRAHGMAIIEIGEIIRLPELVNVQWNNRVDFSIKLKRHTIRVYNVASITSSGGSVIIDEDGQEWSTGVIE